MDINDCLEDSPQTRVLLGLYEEDAELFQGYSYDLMTACKKVVIAQNELTSATQELSSRISTFNPQNFPLDNDENSIMWSTLKQFASTIDEISSWQSILAGQLYDSMLNPLQKFLNSHLAETFTLRELYNITSAEHYQAMLKFSKLPKRRENEKVKQDASEELYISRKKFHKTAMEYFCNLNSLQYRKKIAFVEPSLGFINSQVSFFHMGYEALRQSLSDFLSNINASIHNAQTEMQEDLVRMQNNIEELERSCNQQYMPELMDQIGSEGNPEMPVDKSLAQKSGHLNMRSRSGLTHKWDRIYFFNQGGNLMYHIRGDVAGSLALDLDMAGVTICDMDDRRFVFNVTSHTDKKSIYLQAESECEREEWITVIQNVSRGLYRSPGQNQTDESSTMGRETGKRVDLSPRPLDSTDSTDPISTASSDNKTSFKSPPTPPSSPIESFFPSTPISFDMIYPGEPSGDTVVVAESDDVSYGLSTRIKSLSDFANIDADADTDDHRQHAVEGNSSPSAHCVARFQGAMEVQKDHGVAVIHSTIQQVMAARAIHNVFKTTESHLTLTNSALKLTDPSTDRTRIEFPLHNVAFTCAHSENPRLFGFIIINRALSQQDRTNYECLVFETNTSAEEFSNVLMTARDGALQDIIKKKSLSQETAEVEVHTPPDRRHHYEDNTEGEPVNQDVVVFDDNQTEGAEGGPEPNSQPDSQTT